MPYVCAHNFWDSSILMVKISDFGWKSYFFLEFAKMCLVCAYQKNFCLKVKYFNILSFDIIIIASLFLVLEKFWIEIWSGPIFAWLPALIGESYGKIKKKKEQIKKAPGYSFSFCTLRIIFKKVTSYDSFWLTNRIDNIPDFTQYATFPSRW